MSAGAVEGPGYNVPGKLSWDELQQLPEDVAGGIELWDGNVVWTRRDPFEHQQFSGRMWNALEADARRAMSGPEADGSRRCWQVGMETNVVNALAELNTHQSRRIDPPVVRLGRGGAAGKAR
jgi:hypothetical protein